MRDTQIQYKPRFDRIYWTLVEYLFTLNLEGKPRLGFRTRDIGKIAFVRFKYRTFEG